MPLISVIIPAYNAEKTIQATIESVLQQTFTDFEIIVINDGSRDRTLEILSQICDPRLKIISQTNAGPQKSRNRGIHEAQGEYLAFLDADDLWTPDKLEAQLRALQTHPESAVAYSWTNWVDAAGQFLHRGPHLSPTGNVYAQLLLIDFIGSGSNPLIQREALIATQGFDESLVAGQDWDMWLRLAARYPFVAVSSPQVLYRQSHQSWSSNIKRREAGFKQVIAKALLEAPEAIQSLRRTIIANRYKCLTVDTLQGDPTPKHGLMAAKFLAIALVNDPALLKAKVLAKVLFKIFVVVLLPSHQSQVLLKKFQSLFNIHALHGYVQLEVDSTHLSSVKVA